MSTVVHGSRTTHLRIDPWWSLSIASVLVAAVVASVFAPDLVTGEEQEHLPLAGLMVWMWGSIAIAYIAFLGTARMSPTDGLALSILWVAVAITCVAGPELVTGTDPTRVPIAAFVAPALGTIVTGFLCLHSSRQNPEG